MFCGRKRAGIDLRAGRHACRSSPLEHPAGIFLRKLADTVQLGKVVGVEFEMHGARVLFKLIQTLRTDDFGRDGDVLARRRGFSVPVPACARHGHGYTRRRYRRC